MYKVSQNGNYLVIQKDQEPRQSVFLSKGYNTDKIFSLAYKANAGIVVASKLLDKEIDKLTQKEVISLSPIRLEKKVIANKKRQIQKLDLTSLPINLPEDWLSLIRESSEEERLNIRHFLIWLALNDNTYTRENFLRHFYSSIPYITPNGFIVSVRKVWKEMHKGTDQLYTFIQSALVKVKGWKKSVLRFTIWENNHSGEFRLVETERNAFDRTGWKLKGELSDLIEYPVPESVPTYYSDYSRNHTSIPREKWTVGCIAEVAEKGTHKSVCGINQLHIRSNPLSAISESAYGDTYIVTLTNPKDVINISEGWKYTTSRMYIAAEISEDEIRDTFVKTFGHFDFDYMKLDMKDLLMIDINKEKVRLDEEYKVLNNKVTHLAPEVLEQIILSRTQLVNQ